MLQLHLSDQQFYCLLRCILYQTFEGKQTVIEECKRDTTTANAGFHSNMAWYNAILHILEQECHHTEEIFNTDFTGSCYSDNLWFQPETKISSVWWCFCVSVQYEANSGKTYIKLGTHDQWDIPYLTLMGELLGVYCEYLWENWPLYRWVSARKTSLHC